MYLIFTCIEFYSNGIDLQVSLFSFTAKKNSKNKSFELYDCFVFCKVCRSKILLVIILVLHQFFFYLKRILNFSETFVTYNCSLFSTIFIEICPWWVLIAKLRNLLDVTKDWVISSIIREYVHLSCERFLL